MKGKLFLFFAAILVFSLLLNSVTDDGIAQKNEAVFENLQKIAGNTGNVRVIVKLNVPGIKELTAASNRFSTVIPGKEDEWGGALADMELKDAITRVSDSVLYNLSATDYQVNHTYSSIPFLALSVSEAGLAILESLPEVIGIEEDKALKLPEPDEHDEQQLGKDGSTVTTNPDIPRLENTVGIVGADAAWALGYTGSGWYVAILDSGIRKTHEFFNGKTVVEACYALGEDGTGPVGDCPNGSTSMIGAGSAVPYPGTYAGYDHGTHVAGIATGNNGSLFGVAKDANIIAVQVFSKFSAGACGGTTCVMSWSTDSAAGLDYVYSIRGSYSIASCNMSLGGDAYTTWCDIDIRKEAIDNLRSAGIATAIASGNDGYCNAVGAPACISSSISVGSTNDNDTESYFNNWHPTMQRLFAPGSYVNSSTAASDTSYGLKSGTSMATPHVAGAWAILKQFKPTGSVTDLLNTLRTNGFSVTSVCDNYTTPIPRIQVDKALLGLGEIRVTSPNGGEDWLLGSTHDITWTHSNLVYNIHILLQQNDTNVALLAKNISPASGSFTWTVGNCVLGSVIPGADYKIKIIEKNAPVSDKSDSSFNISTVVPKITVTSPNGGENFLWGTTQNITWTSSDLSNNIHIVLQQNDSNVALLAKNISPAPGSFTWTVGDCLQGTVTPGANYKIMIMEIGTTVMDKSDAAFKINTTVPSITVTSPNGGENWTMGTSQDITWSAFGLFNNLNLFLLQNDVKVALIAQDVNPASGSYTWTVGDCLQGSVNPGSNFKIKVQEMDSTVVDTSNAIFNITAVSASWTFMVYLDADNNLEGDGIDDFLEMSSVGSTAAVNIVTQFDRIGGFDTRYDNWTGTKRYYITQGMTPTIANAVQDLGEMNMADPATLTGFINWAKTYYPATNYALILWNHGGGWRKSEKDQWYEREKNKKDDFIFKAVCWDDSSSGDCLFMSEVKSALNSGGGAQLIGFDACLMGMLEVAYEIRTLGQVMVGSEETEPTEGWPYNTILSDLTSSPAATPSQFASAIVNRYYSSYGNDETQAAIDLTKMNTLASTVSTFAESMIANWDSDQAAVKSAALSVITQLDNTIINDKHGSSWPGANGLAIYFPETTGDMSTSYNGTIIEFPNDTQWEEFLEEFHTAMVGSWIAKRREASQEFTESEHVDLYHFCELLQMDEKDYYRETQISNAFTGGGTAQGFQQDDGYMTYTLPFNFRYFADIIPAGSPIYISSNGYVDFDSGSDHADWYNSASGLAANRRIAPIWDDLLTSGTAQAGEDIYITQSATNLKIRWVAETYGNGTPVNVELVLSDDGSMQFNYGSGNTLLGQPTIGISRGDSINYYLSVYDSVETLTNVDTDVFDPKSGTIRVTSPNGGENWTISSSRNITWDTTGIVGVIKIAILKDGSPIGWITDDIDSDLGSYSWTVGSYIGGTATAGSGYKIKIIEKYTTVFDASDNSFTLNN